MTKAWQKENKTSKKLVLGIVYPEIGRGGPMRKCQNLWNELEFASKNLKINGTPFKISGTSYKTSGKFLSWFTREQIHVVYLCDGLLAHLEQLTKIIKKKKILSIGSSAKYLNKGVAVSFIFKKNETDIVLDFKAASAAKIDFDARFLQIVTTAGGLKPSKTKK